MVSNAFYFWWPSLFLVLRRCVAGSWGCLRRSRIPREERGLTGVQRAAERLFRLGVGIPPARRQPVVQARVPSGGHADVAEKPSELPDKRHGLPARVLRVELKIFECQAVDVELPRQGAGAAVNAALLLGRELRKRPAVGARHPAHLVGVVADQDDLCVRARPLAVLLHPAYGSASRLEVRIAAACNDAGEHREAAPEDDAREVVRTPVADGHEPEVNLAHHPQVHRLQLLWRPYVVIRQHGGERARVAEDARRAGVGARRRTRVAPPPGVNVFYRLAPRLRRREREAGFAASERARLPDRAATLARIAAGPQSRRVVPELNRG